MGFQWWGSSGGAPKGGGPEGAPRGGGPNPEKVGPEVVVVVVVVCGGGGWGSGWVQAPPLPPPRPGSLGPRGGGEGGQRIPLNRKLK